MKPAKLLCLMAAACAGLGARGAPAVPAPRDERFGVMTHFAQGWDPALIARIAAGGITEVRDELYWDSVETEKGVYRFPAAYDRYLDELAREGISPLIVLSFENHLYDGGATPHTAEGFAGYARYAVEVLRHCGPRVTAVEIWNEYNGSFNHGPATTDRARTYLAMLRVVYAAIKRERPDVTVVGGATAGVPLPYWEKLLAGGGLDCMDALSVHPYRYEAPPEGLEGDIAGLRALVRRYGHGVEKPVWVTEIGWQLKTAAAPGDLAIDEAEQARFLVRAYALLLSAGVPRIYWYLFRDDQEFTMGLVHGDAGGSPKLAYGALATMIRQLLGTRFVRRESTPDDLYALDFQRSDGGEVRVLWSLTPRTMMLTGAVAAVDLAGNPVDVSAPRTVDGSPLFVTGPLRGLPDAPSAQGREIANSVRDFSGSPGGDWSYGTFVGNDPTFRPLPTFEVTDWRAAWTGAYPYVSIAGGDQHPSVADRQPVAAVRRWTSASEGTVLIKGSVRCGTQGDGVGVSVAVDGRRRFRKLLGGGAPVADTFELRETVHPGTTIDFAVDPGPGTSIDYDATAVAVTIRLMP